MRKEVTKPMKPIRIIIRSFRDAFKSVVRNFSLSFASIMCTTITLILVAVAIVSAANISNATKLIEDELSIIVYLEKETSEEIENIKTDIESQSNVEKIVYKSKDEWKHELEDYDDTFDTVLNYLEDNPLLETFVVKTKELNKMEDTANYIKSISGVKTVKYGEGSIDTLVTVFDIVQKVVVIVVIALILVTAFLISNTIKLTIFSRKSEIEIMRLVGGSNIAIRLPFLIEGFIIGIIGSIIPICVTIYGYVILYSQLNGRLFTNLIMLIKPYNFVFQVSGVLVIIGGLVGMYGSLKAVRKYLKI